MPPIIIEVEGLMGAGKTTQLKMFQQYIEDMGISDKVIICPDLGSKHTARMGHIYVFQLAILNDMKKFYEENLDKKFIIFDRGPTSVHVFCKQYFESHLLNSSAKMDLDQFRTRMCDEEPFKNRTTIFVETKHRVCVDRVAKRGERVVETFTKQKCWQLQKHYWDVLTTAPNTVYITGRGGNLCTLLRLLTKTAIPYFAPEEEKMDCAAGGSNE